MIRQIRACFNHLKLLGDELLRDLGITSAMRGVMESLEIVGEQTVPQIAKTKGVSRQHIQLLVDALGEAELIGIFTNPQHKRSSLVRLTESGAEAFKEIRRKEVVILEEMAAEMDADALSLTTQTLSSLHSIVLNQLENGENNDTSQ